MCEKLEVLKQGDIIKWELSGHAAVVYGKYHSSKIVMINTEDNVYGVYADYGQDLIPFDECELAK